MSDQHPPVPPPPPPPHAAPPSHAAAAPAKTGGLPVIAWIGIGCAGIALIVILAVGALGMFAVKKGKEFAAEMGDDPVRAAAELVVRVNPDLELVESDPDSGTMTIRDKKSGEVGTFDYSQIKEGKFSFKGADGQGIDVDASQADNGGVTITTDEGEMRIGADADDIADWVVIHPDATDVTVGVTTSDTKKGQGGAISLKFADPPREVAASYKSLLEEAGWQVEEQTITSSGQFYANLSASKDGRTQAVVVTTDEQGGTIVQILYGGS